MDDACLYIGELSSDLGEDETSTVAKEKEGLDVLENECVRDPKVNPFHEDKAEYIENETLSQRAQERYETVRNSEKSSSYENQGRN